MLTINNTLDGYLKDVEIKGNTIQNASNLADIRSVGDKIEGQELYEIPVLSRGKNLFDGKLKFGEISDSTGQEISSTVNTISCEYTKVPNGSSIGVKGFDATSSYAMILEYDSSYNFIQKLPISATGINNIKTLNPKTNYIKFKYQGNQSNLKISVFLNETVATPYEPYQEDKLTILSPVQLEKVGDVADRLIEKNGVWGVEKNVGKDVLTGGENWIKNSDLQFWKGFSLGVKNTNCITDTDKAVINIDFQGNMVLTFYTPITVSEICAWLQNNNVTVKYILETPQFIPLPHSQQVKLRTFANKTNISFLTEIEGMIKAQVPKSIGATVNTHTEQINNLNKELDRVKKLEESTVSTVTTESDFTTVEATSNGYFEDVKLEGKTLVVNANNEVVEPGTEGATLKSVGDGVDEIVVSSVNSDNTKADKKRLLYYNEETQSWEKPILRQWDSIEKHADGKYYYHVRSIEEEYTEGDETVTDYITDMTKTVKKNSSEKVYECTNIDLITYANETNYIIECGAITPKSTFEIHCNISNVVSMLQRKASISESNLLTSNGGGNGDHTHSNLSVLNNITQTKVNEWNSKADSTHSHSEYANYSHTHNASEIEGLENVDIDLSDYYTKSETYNKTEIDSKIANMGAGGSVDLSNYYTKSETDEVVNNKADKVHTHSEYLTELPTHAHSEYLTEHQDISHKADKEDTYTKNQTDSKISEEIAKAQLGGGSEVDLSAYATKTYVDNEISKIELKEGPKGPQGEKGDTGEVGPQGPQGETPSIAHLEANISNKISEVDELIHQLTNNRTIDGGEL